MCAFRIATSATTGLGDPHESFSFFSLSSSSSLHTTVIPRKRPAEGGSPKPDNAAKKAKRNIEGPSVDSTVRNRVWPESELVTYREALEIVKRNSQSDTSIARDWASIFEAIAHHRSTDGESRRALLGHSIKKMFSQLHFESEIHSFHTEKNIKEKSVFKVQADKMIEDDIFTPVTGIPVTFWRMLDDDGRKLKAGENDYLARYYNGSLSDEEKATWNARRSNMGRFTDYTLADLPEHGLK